MRRTASHAEDRAQEPQFPQGALPSDVVAAFWKTTVRAADAGRDLRGYGMEPPYRHIALTNE
jgi:hypothetical protein